MIEITNRGQAAATNVKFTDTPDTLTVLVAGTVHTSQGTVTKGNNPGDADLAVDIGTLPVGGVVRVSFQAKLKNNLTRLFILNQGTVTGSNIPNVPTDDPDTPDPGDPTRTNIPPGEATLVTLVGFTATREANGIVVRWSTSAELNTFGFYLYRSADGQRAHAVRVTADLIPARGRGGSGITDYSWLDTAVQSDTIYSYWLQEVELNGTTNEYGPASAAIAPAQGYRTYLPIAFR